MNNDLISREALIEAITSETRNEFEFICLSRLFEIIDNAPTVTPDKIQAIMSDYLIYRCEPERPQGEWITVHYAREELNCPEKSMLDFVKCPFCETIHQGRHNFCSRCGADMRKGGTE